MELSPDYMGGVAEVQISAASMIAATNKEVCYRGAKEHPWTANHCACCAMLASALISIFQFKMQQ
jgi:hypothetical protein